MLTTNKSWLSALLTSLALTTSSSLAQATTPYAVQDIYDKTNFFNGFEFFSGPDPTEGFVRYSTAQQANASSLAGYANNAVYLGVDSQSPDVVAPGRASTRVNSKKTYTRGLFVADIAHMPSSTCGVWAAFWMFGDPWPSAGEIDIIEGVNRAQSTSFTLHTSSGCTFQKQGNCNAPGDGTKGCTEPGFQNTQTYGDGFNAIGGGTFATEWTSSEIRMWFFPRTQPIPADLAANAPNPDTAKWGAPAAVFQGGGGNCDIDSHFKQHRLVFNTALCGQWAGKVFSQDSQCASLADSCEAYVAANPDAFKQAYWLINSVKVFSRENGGAAATVPVPASAPAPAVPVPVVQQQPAGGYQQQQSPQQGSAEGYEQQQNPAGKKSKRTVTISRPLPPASLISNTENKKRKSVRGRASRVQRRKVVPMI